MLVDILIIHVVGNGIGKKDRMGWEKSHIEDLTCLSYTNLHKKICGFLSICSLFYISYQMFFDIVTFNILLFL